jgi:hypothetical protein
MTKPCPKYRRLNREVMNGEYMKNLTQKNQDLLEFVNENAGTKGKTIGDIVDIADILTVQVST